MKKIYYEKKGRRYVPVAEYDNDYFDSFPKGATLVMCRPGSTSRRYLIDPALAPMIAAGIYAEDAMCKAVMEGSEAKPKKAPLTPEQVAAWQQMKEAFGSDMFYIQYPSARDSVEAGIKAMQAEAEKLLSHPSVRKAYDQFMLMCQLVKENEKTND